MRVVVIFLILCSVVYFVPLFLFEGVTVGTLWSIWLKHPGLILYEVLITLACSFGFARAFPKKA